VQSVEIKLNELNTDLLGVGRFLAVG
jgi:hypothetical protein